MKFLVFVAITSLELMVNADDLSSDLRPPLFAQGAGGLRLDPPFLDSPKPRQETVASPPITNAVSTDSADDVEREEVAMLKTVDGQLVRTVAGRFAYKSPEGVPVAVKYTADENGYRASFSIGIDTGRKSQPFKQISDRGQGATERPGGPGGSGLSAGNGYLPPPTQVNNGYLPPSTK